ncbi:MAG: DUF5801 repeats-in-toxin domain-containing protein, partial [Pelodictyon phaeoclathratiforme]
MSTNNTISLATVTETVGKVWAELEDGTSRLLQAGDAVYEGEVVRTEAGGLVVLQAANGAVFRITEGKEFVLGAGLFGTRGTLFNSDIAGLVAETEGGTPPLQDEIPDGSTPSVLTVNNQSEATLLHGYIRVERVVESVNTPPYFLWAYTGRYNASTNSRTASYSPLLEGRATFDERLVIPVEPLTFAEVEPVVLLKPITMPYSSSLPPNDVPKNNSVEVTVSVQEDALPEGNRDTPEDTTIATGSVAPLVDTGADIAVTFSLQTSGLDAGWTSNGVPLTYTVSGNTLTASVPSGPVFTLFVDPFTGAFTFTLFAPFDHPAGSGEEGLLTIDLSSAIVVTDNNGDAITVDGGFAVIVENDVPVGVGRLEANVDEDELVPFGISDSDGVTTVATGNISALFSAGADQPLTYGLLTNTVGLPQDLTSAGDSVTYAVTGNTLTATAGGRTVFSLVLDPSTGDYTFTLSAQLDHPLANGDDNEILPLDLTSILQATDKDGDKSASSGIFIINVEDDVPVGTGTVVGNVDEDELPDGITDGDPETTVATGSLGAFFLIGADQPGIYGLSGNTGGLPSLTSAGVPVSYSVSGTTLTATAGGNTVFTLSIDPVTGNYRFELLDQLDHPNANGDDNEILPLNLTSILKITDKDGDPLPVSGTFTINVEDDVPVGTGTVVGAVQEDALLGANRETASQTTTVTGSIAGLVLIGADQPGSYIYTLSGDTTGLPVLSSAGLPVGYTFSPDGGTLTAYVNLGGNSGYDPGTDRPVFTLVIDSVTGNYEFELLDQLDHPRADGDDTETLLIDFTSILRVSDQDGDPLATFGTLRIYVEDDVPIASQTPITDAVDEDSLDNYNAVTGFGSKGNLDAVNDGT